MGEPFIQCGHVLGVLGLQVGTALQFVRQCGTVGAIHGRQDFAMGAGQVRHFGRASRAFGVDPEEKGTRQGAQDQSHDGQNSPAHHCTAMHFEWAARRRSHRPQHTRFPGTLQSWPPTRRHIRMASQAPA